MLGCHICYERADFQLSFDCITCEDHLYFCKNHKPSNIKLEELDEKQAVKDSPTKTSTEEKEIIGCGMKSSDKLQLDCGQADEWGTKVYCGYCLEKIFKKELNADKEQKPKSEKSK